jgi:hypothetical protein
LSGSDAFREFPASAVAGTYFNGAVSIDEMHFPTRGFSGMSIRIFDPAKREWTVYWVNSRTGRLQSPVRGRWVDGVSLLFGDDEYNGRPVRASYRWSDVASRTARWEQAFSTDGGQSWETNWVMNFTRRSHAANDTGLPKLSSDFDFLVGQWSVTHRCLKTLLNGSDEWSEFPGIAASRTHFSGAVSIDEFDFPGRGNRGLAIRLRDPQTGVWSIYWVDSRDGRLQPPVHGTFDAGIGTFYGDDEHDGRAIRVRYIWSDVTEQSARWQQAFSADAGRTWETNWVMHFTRD